MTRKERELEELTKLSGNMENVINKQNEFLKLEQARLQTLLDHTNADLQSARDEVESLSKEVSTLEVRQLERDRFDEENNREHLRKVGELERRLMETQQQLAEKASLALDFESQLGNIQHRLSEVVFFLNSTE